jgi:EspG family
LFPFQIPSFGALIEDRINIARAVQGDMQRRGLARGDDVDPSVLTALRLVADYHVAIAVMGTVDGGREIYGRASATPRGGVVVRQDQQMLVFELIRPETLAHAAVALLPNEKAGPGQSVMITTPAAPAPQRNRDEEDAGFSFAQPVRGTRGMSEAQLGVAKEILRRPRKGGGYFVVSGKDRRGHEIQAPGLSWIDTDAGRYLVQTRPGEGGQSHGTFAPADAARLTHQLSDLLRSVSGG